MHIIISPKTCLKFLLQVVGFLFAANVGGIILQRYTHHQIATLFDFNRESNIPSFYSSFALLMAGVLLALIAYFHFKHKQKYFLWALLALVFVFLCVDEFSSLHERLDDPLRSYLGVTGALFYAWIIPYAIFGLLLLVLYTKFLLSLPTKVMWLFLASGAMYVCGAIGFELIEGILITDRGFGVAYTICYSLEELLEMLGVVFFIFALLLYICEKFPNTNVTLQSTD